jgi:capsular polysaccharide biosynthesis protein
LRDAVVALQRNSSNYFHFLTEVMPSLMTWQNNLHENDTIAVASAPFASSLLQLAGFKQRVSLLRQPASIRATNVKLLRMLPVGYFNPALLRELSRRVVRSVNPGNAGHEVLFLTRARRDRRNLTNESEVLEMVRQRFPNVDVVIPGELAVEDQVRRCHSARIVIASHGAHAANLLWSDRLEQFVELGAKEDRSTIAMARLLGAHTHHCLTHPITPSEHWSDHTCELKILKKILTAL